MPQYPHRMRLRGPWECTPLASRTDHALPQARRVVMPCSWAGAGLAGFAGRVRFTRRFGYPGRIDEHERVWLVGERLDGHGDIVVNGHTLARGHQGPFAFDVTTILGPRNELDIVIDAERDDAGLTDDVGLEIRCTAYLDGMTAMRGAGGGIAIRGSVVGEADGPLEIYVIVGGVHSHYQTVQPTVNGVPLDIDLPPSDPAAPSVRVELVNVATVWYAWETEVV